MVSPGQHFATMTQTHTENLADAVAAGKKVKGRWVLCFVYVFRRSFILSKLADMVP